MKSKKILWISLSVFIIITIFLAIYFPKNQVVKQMIFPKKAMCKNVILQPFDNFPSTYSNYIKTHLETLNLKVEVRNSIQFPENSWNKKHSRHRADSLIKFLKSQTTNDTVIIGLTDMDISTTRNNISDYGIMGLGFCPGKSCIASTYRLRRKNLMQQYLKIVLHEFGHTQGLPHCPDPTCIMRDAKGKNHTEEMVRFCPNCSKVVGNLHYI